MTILVTGAGGNIGSRVVATLAAAGHDVRGTAREMSTLKVPTGVETAELDITAPSTAGDVLRDVETLFLYPTFEPNDDFLAAAVKAGVRHVVLLSSPASYEPGEQDRVIGQAHRVVERSLEGSGLSHTVLYPHWLANNAERDWGDEIRSTGRVGIAYPDAQFSPTHLDDISEVAADLLTRDRHRARMVVVTGPESLSQRDIVGVIAEETGRPIVVDELSREDVSARRPEWMPEPVLEVLLDVQEMAVGVPAPVTNTVERITGHPARPFRQWVREHWS